MVCGPSRGRAGQGEVMAVWAGPWQGCAVRPQLHQPQHNAACPKAPGGPRCWGRAVVEGWAASPSAAENSAALWGLST